MSAPDRNDPILARAARLPTEISPERDLWPGIAARLERPAGASGRPGRSWHWPAAMAAGLVVVALTAAITWRLAVIQFAAPPAEVLAGLIHDDRSAGSQPGAELVDVRNQLLGSLHQTLSRLPPESQRTVVDNLLEIRASLDEIEAALSRDPDDASLQQLLYTTYEQELQMLWNLNRMTQPLATEVET